MAALVIGLHVPAAQAARPVEQMGVGLRAQAQYSAQWSFKVLHDPERVRVLDGKPHPVATFTVGARTVTLRGPLRILAEPATTSATVRSKTWVRLLARPFNGRVDVDWLRARLADRRPDVIAIALQYVTDAPLVRSAAGAVIGGDADYGPLQADGTRAEGSDFNDYLGLTWTYDDGPDRAEGEQLGSLDCSGFIRMVWGFRLDVPLVLRPDARGLARRSFELLQSGPGVVTVPNTGRAPSSSTQLLPGDLVFFDANRDDGDRIDHVGLYLGRDSAGARRFVSSRKTVNGPTLGDVGGRSVLTGTGLYAMSWRAARRL